MKPVFLSFLENHLYLFLSLCMFEGAPVAVGMTIDVASIDMVSEVNMVSVHTIFSYSCTLHAISL